jgi:Pyridoxamine 5'-phosphate oxidase
MGHGGTAVVGFEALVSPPGDREKQPHPGFVLDALTGPEPSSLVIEDHEQLVRVVAYVIVNPPLIARPDRFVEEPEPLFPPELIEWVRGAIESPLIVAETAPVSKRSLAELSAMGATTALYFVGGVPVLAVFGMGSGCCSSEGLGTSAALSGRAHGPRLSRLAAISRAPTLTRCVTASESVVARRIGPKATSAPAIHCLSLCLPLFPAEVWPGITPPLGPGQSPPGGSREARGFDAMIWREFEATAPEIARMGKERLDRPGVAFLGTLRRDGSPRISPVEPRVSKGHLLVGAMPWSRKAQDLARDPRCVLHSAVTDPDSGEGEFKLYGRVEQVQDRDVRDGDPTAWWVSRPLDAALVFSLGIEEAVLVSWDIEQSEMTVQSWSAGRGLSEAKRSYP